MFRILVLTGPSAAGKTTLGGLLGWPEIIGHTARPPRPGESDRNPYYFVTDEEIERMERDGELVEINRPYGGYLYALAEGEVKNRLAENDRVYVILEENGIRQVKAHPIYGPMTKVVFISATKNDCEDRMRKRGQTEDDIRTRLSRYETEMKGAEKADAVIENKVLNTALRFLKDITNYWSLNETEEKSIIK